MCHFECVAWKMKPTNKLKLIKKTNTATNQMYSQEQIVEQIPAHHKQWYSQVDVAAGSCEDQVYQHQQSSYVLPVPVSCPTKQFAAGAIGNFGQRTYMLSRVQVPVASPTDQFAAGVISAILARHSQAQL